MGEGTNKAIWRIVRTSKKILATPLTNIYVFKLLENRGRTKCQKRYVSPILQQSALIRLLEFFETVK